jgi:hypothetical protein
MTQADSTNQFGSRRRFLSVAILGAGGLVIGKTALSNQGASADVFVATDPEAAATSTRQAELTEIATLRTQVAESEACENGTPVAEPTPPPVDAGTPVPYGDRLTVTALGIAPALVPPEMKVVGQVLQVNYEVTNLSVTPISPPWSELTLTGVNGRESRFDLNLNGQLLGYAAGALSVVANATESLSVVFDFPEVVETSFILGSTTEPDFRVALEVIQRG